MRHALLKCLNVSSLRLNILVLSVAITVIIFLSQLCCYEEGTEKLVQSIGPIHPETHEAEFRNLKKGNYVVFLEVYVSQNSD